MLWYSLEAPRRGAANEYPHYMFSLRNKKDINIFRMKKKTPYLLLCVTVNFYTDVYLFNLSFEKNSCLLV